jgi:cysteine desulfurase
LKLNVDRLYLDYNATSPLSHSVLDWVKSGDLLFANPASQHSSGKASRKSINETRALVFKTFGKSENNTKLFFHSGATEGVMSFAYSFSEWARIEHRNLLICYSGLDHPAVTSLSERYFGPETSYFELRLTQNLEYDHPANFKALQEKKAQNPELIILYHHLWVHNETGIVSPLQELQDFKKIPDLYIHVDAVQTPGKIADWKSLTTGDIFTYSAHKFGSLKGIGFSFFPKSLKFHPLISGGGQQSNLRSGTENPQGTKSIALALSDLDKVDVARVTKLRQKLDDFMSEALKGVGGIISSRSKNRNSNTIYFYLNDLSSDIALALFDLNGLMISAGSACSSGAARTSAIMNHLGFTKEAKNGLRISFSFDLSESELEEIIKRLKVTFSKLKA